MSIPFIPVVLTAFSLTVPALSGTITEKQSISMKNIIVQEMDNDLLIFELKCKDEYDKKNILNPKRTPTLQGYLPIAYIENGCIVLQGVASLENIPVKIENDCGETVYSALLTISKGETQSISLAGMDEAEYILSISFSEEEEYLARFRPVHE